MRLFSVQAKAPGDILNLTPQCVAGHLKLSESKTTCLNLEKCSLLLTPPAEIARETHGSVMHHLLSPLFSSYRTKYSKE